MGIYKFGFYVSVCVIIRKPYIDRMNDKKNIFRNYVFLMKSLKLLIYILKKNMYDVI